MCNEENEKVYIFSLFVIIIKGFFFDNLSFFFLGARCVDVELPAHRRDRGSR